MKKILLLVALCGFAFGDDFKFNPETDNLYDLTRFCWKSHKSGVNFGYTDNKNQELCNKYANEAIEFYTQKCDDGDKVGCGNAGVITTMDLAM